MERGYWNRIRRANGVVYTRVHGNIRLVVFPVREEPDLWYWEARSDNHHLSGLCKTVDYAKRSAVRAARDRWVKRQDSA